MQDFRDLHMFINEDRAEAERFLGFLSDHGQIMGLLAFRRSELPVKENVLAMTEAAQIDKLKWYRTLYLYANDDPLLVLVAEKKHAPAFLSHLQTMRDKYNQDAFVYWDGSETTLVYRNQVIHLPDYTHSLTSLDELAGYLIPGFQTAGMFNGSMSFVQMRDHQTRPKNK